MAQQSDISTQSPAAQANVRKGSWRSIFGRVPDELGVFSALVILVLFIGILRPIFFSVQNLSLLLSSSAFYGLIALGSVYLVSLGEIDLSVGWNFNFSAVVAANAMLSGIDPWISALIGVLFGAFLGLLNGVLTVGLRLPVIIVTLGTFSVFRGLSLVANQSRAVVPPDSISAYSDFLNYRIFGSIPMLAVIFVILAIVLHLVLHNTRFGYQVQAIGSNKEAARLAGLPIARIKITVLILVGAICGLSGSLFVGFRGAVDPSSGGDFMLTVIAAVIIGGTPLSGGRGTVIGAMFGVMIISVISTGVIFFGVGANWSTFVTGIVTIVAVAIDQIIKYQRDRRARSVMDVL